MFALQIPLPLSLFNTRYLSAVGLTVLVYDHLLLLGQEVQYIWAAKSSSFKWLFLYNHYSVPMFLIANSLALGPYPVVSWLLSFVLVKTSSDLKSCKNWFTAGAILIVSSVCIVNIFVAQRIYVLWGFNKTVLKLVTFGIVTAYTGSFIVTAIGLAQSYPFIVYNPILRSCATLRVTKLLAVGFGIPLYLELINFILLCYNALHRPRHLHTHIVKQLYFDGVVYFWVITILRVINIAAVAGAFSQENTLLFAFFLWAMVPASVHRMMLTLNDNVRKGNGTKYLRRPWFSSNPSPTALLTVPSNNSNFNIVEETYSITDSVL